VMRDIAGVELPESLVKLGADLPPATEVAASQNGDVAPAKA
jgi:hypothetical protein